MEGVTLKEANELWDAGQDVLCPYCEHHIEEDDFSIFHTEELFHPVCAQKCRREMGCADAFDRKHFDV